MCVDFPGMENLSESTQLNSCTCGPHPVSSRACPALILPLLSPFADGHGTLCGLSRAVIINSAVAIGSNLTSRVGASFHKLLSHCASCWAKRVSVGEVSPSSWQPWFAVAH